MATPYTPATSLLSPGRIGQPAWVAALLAGSANRKEGPPLTRAQATEIVAIYHQEGGK